MAKSSTSFKIGNQAAKDHGFGRPRNFVIEDEATALIEWAKLPTALVLNGFGPTRGYSSKSMYQWETESAVFLEAMNMARDLISERLQQILIEKGNARPFDRYATLLDKRLHQHEREDATFELEHKAKLERMSTASPEQEQGIQALMSQIKALQESADKLASSNKRTETKS